MYITNDKKGISLITLIITIVVVIILAAVVILALGNNNPIDSARLSTVVNSKTNMEDCISIVASKKIAETEGKEQMSDIVKSIIDESASEVKFTQDGTEKTIYRIAPDEFESRLGIVVKETPNKDCIWYVDNAGKVYLVFDFMKNVPNYLKESDTTLNKSVKNFVIVLDSALESSIIENIEISKTEDTVGVGEDKNITLDLSKVEGLSYSKWVINESKEKLGVEDEAKYPNTVEGNSVEISLKSITNPGTYYLHVLVCTNDMKVEKISSAIVVEKKADVWDGSIAEGFASGDGTEANPYIIETAAQFAYFGDQITNGKGDFRKKFVKLNNDLDLNNIEWTPIGGDNINGKRFYGTFDGEYNKIYNLKVTQKESFAGLFSLLGGEIKNLGIESGILEQNSDSANNDIGALVSNSRGTITNCYNKAKVIGGCAGGITGVNNGTISNCYNEGEIISKITSSGMAGGIAGALGANSSNAKISNCYNRANITSMGGHAGGIVGQSTSATTTENSYNYGHIKAPDDVGGITGCAEAYQNYNYTRNCYNLGKVEGTSENSNDVGGVVGYAQREIKNCYNSGELLVNQNSKANDVGGILAYSNSATLTNNYYLTGTAKVGLSNIFGSVQTEDKAGSYEATDTMPSVISVINGQNAFIEDTKNINNGYPILSWQTK